MREIKFRVWHHSEQKMYFCGYQKLFHVLLCDDDQGKNDGKGIPVKRERYECCEMLESTDLWDCRDQEVFEGDIVQVRIGGKSFKGVVESVPDMFRSRKLHPLQSLLEKHGVVDQAENMELEVLGNHFESPDLLNGCA